MDCVKEYGRVDPEVFEKLLLRLDSIDQSFAPSKLYSTEDKSKFVDETKRLSVFREMKDKCLFDLVDLLVKALNEKDPSMVYRLQRNDLTEIHYKEGGFFEAHEDYLSLTSNGIQEFTLLLCLDAECEGGETRFSLNPFFSYSSPSSVTKEHLLVFRKDLVHEGLPIRKGYKKILTGNLWAFPKSKGKSLVISFDSETEDSEPGDIYVLPYHALESFPHCMLHSLVRWNEAPGRTDEDQALGHYPCTTCTYKDFEVIYKILSKAYISLEDYRTYRELIDFFGFCSSDLLMDLTPPSSKLEEPKVNEPVVLDKDLIICRTREEQAYVCSTLPETHLPYIPFRMAFGEGDYLVFKEGMPDVEASEDLKDMELVYADFGEDLHMWYTGALCAGWGGKRIVSPSPLDGVPFREEETSESDDSSDEKKDDESSDDDDYQPPPIDYRTKDHLILNDQGGDSDCEDYCSRNEESSQVFANLLEGARVCVDLEEQVVDGFTIEMRRNPVVGNRRLEIPLENLVVPPHNLYSIKDNGKGATCMTLPQLKALHSYIKETKVTERVEEALPTLGGPEGPLCFSQQKIRDTGFLCNENAYSHFNLVFVYGFLKIENE